MSWFSRLAGVFRGASVNRDIDEELQSHLDEARDRGRDAAEARRALGSTLRLREQSRDVRVLPWLDSLRADVIFAWRQLRKNRTASAAAVLSLALAMGSSVAAFRLVNALWLRPLPVSAPDRLFVLSYPLRNSLMQVEMVDSFDYPQFRQLRSAVAADTDLLAITYPRRQGEVTFGSDDQTEAYWSQMVSGDMFRSFGLQPALGRLLTAADDVTPGAHPVAVLSYDYWTRRFGRDPGVVGRKFRDGGAVYEIIGVCQKGFTGTDPGTLIDVFVPTMMNAKAINSPNWGWFRTWAHLKPGANADVVREKLRAAGRDYRLERTKAWPQTEAVRRAEYVQAAFELRPAASGASRLQEDFERPMLVLGIVAALVLLIASVNVANLMSARAATRQREMALRVSIGAGRWRLAQLCLAESVLIALAAAALGTLFAAWAAPFVVAQARGENGPTQLILSADARVLAFTAAMTLMVTILFGIAPALKASAVKPMATLRGGEDPHARHRTMNVLVAAQVAFCFLVCFVTALMVTTFQRLSKQPMGFASDGLVTLETGTRDHTASTRWDEIRRRLQDVGGVENVAVGSWALLSTNAWTGGVSVPGVQPDGREPYFLSVSPGWLDTMKIPLVSGRDLREGETNAAIVNEEFARTYFHGQDPVGRTFSDTDSLTPVHPQPVRWQIVGCMRNSRYADLREPVRPTVYVSLDTKGTDWSTFVVRARGLDPLALGATLKTEIANIRPEFRVSNIRTQNELIELLTIRERLVAMLSAFFAIVAVALAGIGLYGVLNYSVIERRREIGIRMALGARASRVVAGILRHASLMVLLGGIAGVVAGMMSRPLLEKLLYEVKLTDPAMLAAPALLLLVVALAASAVPALRAVRVDPAETLRAE